MRVCAATLNFPVEGSYSSAMMLFVVTTNTLRRGSNRLETKGIGCFGCGKSGEGLKFASSTAAWWVGSAPPNTAQPATDEGYERFTGYRSTGTIATNRIEFR